MKTKLTAPIKEEEIRRKRNTENSRELNSLQKAKAISRRSNH